MFVAQFGTSCGPASSSASWLGPGVKLGGWLGTTSRMDTGADVTFAPKSSMARAVRTAVPGGASVQTRVKGATVASPILLVRLKYSTFAMVPSSSLALAVSDRLVGRMNVAPLVGATRRTVGRAFCAYFRTTTS